MLLLEVEATSVRVPWQGHRLALSPELGACGDCGEALWRVAACSRSDLSQNEPEQSTASRPGERNNVTTESPQTARRSQQRQKQTESFVCVSELQSAEDQGES